MQEKSTDRPALVHEAGHDQPIRVCHRQSADEHNAGTIAGHRVTNHSGVQRRQQQSAGDAIAAVDTGWQAQLISMMFS